MSQKAQAGRAGKERSEFGRAPPAPKKLTHPFMGFLTIETYEIRVEILASGEAILALLDFPLIHPSLITVDEQDALKAEAIDQLSQVFGLV